jgi:hypothetical protein
MIQIDRYTITARFLPAVIIAAPLAAAIHAWLPFPLTWTKGAAATAVLAGLAYILSHATRNAGRQLEDTLWPRWGGAPTTLMLRHSDSMIDPVTKARYHQALVKLGAVQNLPDADAERADPKAADDCYEGATTWLRGRTRSRKDFPLVFEENVNYGFMRNLLACKPWGLASAFLSLAVIAAAFWQGNLPVIEGVVAFGVALYLIFAVTERGLRSIAEAYANNLLEAIDHLSGQKPTQTSSSKRSVSGKLAIKRKAAAS